MSTESYNGWANQETWAVALHINNDQGWQESVLEQLREDRESHAGDGYTQTQYEAGDIIREWVEGWLEDAYTDREWYLRVRDIGSLWRVSWTELGAAFLEDLGEEATD